MLGYLIAGAAFFLITQKNVPAAPPGQRGTQPPPKDSGAGVNGVSQTNGVYNQNSGGVPLNAPNIPTRRDAGPVPGALGAAGTVTGAATALGMGAAVAPIAVIAVPAAIGFGLATALGLTDVPKVDITSAASIDHYHANLELVGGDAVHDYETKINAARAAQGLPPYYTNTTTAPPTVLYSGGGGAATHSTVRTYVE